MNNIRISYSLCIQNYISQNPNYNDLTSNKLFYGVYTTSSQHKLINEIQMQILKMNDYKYECYHYN